jgi:hypothetical protein
MADKKREFTMIGGSIDDIIYDRDMNIDRRRVAR